MKNLISLFLILVSFLNLSAQNISGVSDVQTFNMIKKIINNDHAFELDSL